MAYNGLTQPTQRIDAWPETGHAGLRPATSDVDMYGLAGEEPAADDRDRLVVHGVWECLLALIVVLAGVAVVQIDSNALAGTGLRSFLLLAAALGFVAAGLGWSLRAAAPNLAIGSVALAAAVFFADQADGGFGFGLAVTLAAAALTGLLLAIVVVGFHTPAWAGSLALVLLLGGWLTSQDLARATEATGYRPASHALYWFFGFAAVSVLGGMLSMTRGFRNGVGASRAAVDPAERPGFGAGLAAMAALVGSQVLAAVGGVLMALTGAVPVTGLVGVDWTGLALGVVLLGGTSAYGRRGGVFGTLLAVVLLGFVMRLAAEQHWSVPVLWYAGVAIVLGLLVTRLVETFGSPRPAAGEESSEWESDVAWPAGRPSPPVSGSHAGPGGYGGGPGGYGGGRGGVARHLESTPGTRPLLALPAASPAEPPSRAGHAGASAATGRLGGPTGPGGAAEPDRFGGGGVPQRGGIGDRVDRLPHRLGPAQGNVVHGEVVPGSAGRRHVPTQGNQVPPGRIWDVDPRTGRGPGGPGSPSPY